MDPNHANLQLCLSLLKSHLYSKPSPTLSRITSDHMLSFSKNTSLLKAQFFLISKPYVVSLLPHDALVKFSFLFHSDFFMATFCLSFTRMVFFLCVPKLMCFHRATSRAITSCFSSSHIHHLVYEGALPPLQVTLTHFTMILVAAGLSSSTFYSTYS